MQQSWYDALGCFLPVPDVIRLYRIQKKRSMEYPIAVSVTCKISISPWGPSIICACMLQTIRIAPIENLHPGCTRAFVHLNWTGDRSLVELTRILEALNPGSWEVSRLDPRIWCNVIHILYNMTGLWQVAFVCNRAWLSANGFIFIGIIQSWKPAHQPSLCEIGKPDREGMG